jgi:hypothetical protein
VTTQQRVTDGIHWKSYWTSTIISAEVEYGVCRLCGDPFADEDLCVDCLATAGIRCFECERKVPGSEIRRDVYGTPYCGRCA